MEEAKSQEKFVHGIFALFSRKYRDDLRAETTKGQTVKAERGEYPGRAPFGYLHDTRAIKADPRRAPVVKRIFKLYASKAHSALSLRQAIRKETGERISESQLHKMLQNRFYIGFFTWHGIEYKAVHEPLVDHETFKRCQEVLADRSRSSARR